MIRRAEPPLARPASTYGISRTDKATERIIDELREKVDRYRTTDPKDLRRMLRETLEEHFAAFDTTLRLTERPLP